MASSLGSYACLPASGASCVVQSTSEDNKDLFDQIISILEINFLDIFEKFFIF